MAKPTEGQWFVQDNTDLPFGQLRVDSDYGCVAICGTNDRYFTVDDELRANATLIASAKELLLNVEQNTEALKTAEMVLAERGIELKEITRQLSRNSAVIVKATGGKP